MAVIVEAISVILRRDVIDAKFAGGWSEFERRAANRSACTDGDLVRLGFMTKADVEAFEYLLQDSGLEREKAGGFADYAIIDQRAEPELPVSWLEAETVTLDGMRVKVCRSTGKVSEKFSKPKNWKYESSSSFCSPPRIEGAPGYRLAYVRREDGADIFLDQLYGREWRSVEIDGQIRMVETRVSKDIEQFYRQALAFEKQKRVFVEDSDLERLKFWRVRVRDIFLPQVMELEENEASKMGRLYFLQGFLLRVIADYTGAKKALKKAISMQSGVTLYLREISHICGMAGQDKEAAAWMREATATTPGDVRLWTVYALCLVRLKQREDALRAVNFALHLDPENEEVLDLKESFEERLVNA